MNDTVYKDDQAFLSGTGSKENELAIGNFFYDLKPTRDAGVGLTEQTIDYIVDVKGSHCRHIGLVTSSRKSTSTGSVITSLLARPPKGHGMRCRTRLSKHSNA
jgi:hypothetical protein